MPGEISFGLLGPVQVTARGTAHPVRAARLRTLLAALLLRDGRTVAADELADEVWDGAPPSGAAATLPSYVLRLRRALGPDAGARLLTRPPGYLIEVLHDGELDLRQFTALRRQAGEAAAAGDWPGAAAGWRAALGLWRGSALEDIPDVYLKAREVPALRAGWIQVHEDLARADLELGRHGDVAERVTRLQAGFPYREELSGLLMQAQVSAGRPAEALEEYARLRRTLISELGVEPGPRVQALQAAVLAGGALPPWPRAEPAARPAKATLASARAAARPVPRQLPGAVRHFVGRPAELRTLSGLAAVAAHGETVIAAVSGMAGSGKTALAVHWAHQAAEQFPDGQLSIDLRGFGPAGTPVTPAAAVRAFLDALGVPTAEVPVGHEAQAALYRSLLAGKRLLVLLDNARDEQHVRPLLPGGPGCLVVITSRTRLTGLAATDGAHLLSLGLLTRQETTRLLEHHLGEDRMAAAPAAVDELVTQSAGLALAASILAARAAGTARSLTAFAAELRGERERLDALDTGDGRTDLRAVFSWSCRYLSPRAARVFRLLGLHPGPHLTLAAAASLAGLPPREARAAMSELSRAHLVTEQAPDGFAVHDLLRDYASERAEAAETAAGRQAAVHRLLDYYLHSAGDCADALGRAPQAAGARLSPPPGDVTVERFASPVAALEWFNAHQPLLTAAVAWSAECGRDSHCCRLLAVLRGLFDQNAHWQPLADTALVALQAARRLGDRQAEGMARRALGYARGRTGHYHQAVRHFQVAAEIFRSAGAPADRATCHRGLAWVLGMSGRHNEAMAHAQRAVDLTRDAPATERAHALNMVGRCHAYLGAYQFAVLACDQALTMHRREGNRLGEAEACYSLGLAHQGAGDPGESLRAYQEALELFGELGDRHYIGETLAGLGDAHQSLGDRAQAVRLWQGAVGILTDIGHPDTDRVRAQLGAAVPALS